MLTFINTVFYMYVIVSGTDNLLDYWIIKTLEPILCLHLRDYRQLR